MKIWRIAGLALLAGLILFLLTVLLKLFFVALTAALLIRVVGGQLMRRFAGPAYLRRDPATHIISIDNPTYQSPGWANAGRVISIN